MILSYEHGLIRKDYLEKMLKGLPKGKICMKNAHGKLVKSVYVSNCDDEYHCRKYYVVRKEPGKTFAAKISLSQKLGTQLEETLAALKTEAEPKPRKLRSSKEKWDRIKASERNGYPFPEYAPEYKGVKYRSKSEQIIASVLDQCGFEFVYEPVIFAGGRKLCPDFAVYVRETGRIIFIEHFGLTEIRSYRDNMVEKIGSYLSEGFIEGRDIIFFFENNKGGVDPAVIRGKLNAAVICGAL